MFKHKKVKEGFSIPYEFNRKTVNPTLSSKQLKKLPIFCLPPVAKRCAWDEVAGNQAEKSSVDFFMHLF